MCVYLHCEILFANPNILWTSVCQNQYHVYIWCEYVYIYNNIIIIARGATIIT